MLLSFHDFYPLVKDKSVDWDRLKDSLKITEDKYPTNQEVEAYYQEIFNGKTANINRSKWHSMDKMLCVWVVVQYCELFDKNCLSLNKTDFKAISRILGVESGLLEFKWLKLIKPYIKNKPWSEAQDLLVGSLMSEDGQKRWTYVALKLSKSSVSRGLRTAKQVRERWINYIDPSINRGEWTLSQDQQLLKLVQQYGKKWSILGKELKRTQNSIKNRFNSLSIKNQSNNLKLSFLKKESPQNSVTIVTKIQDSPKFCNFIVDMPYPNFFMFPSMELKVCGYRELVTKNES